MSPDLINGVFEAVGAATVITNVARLYRDKVVRGVNVSTTAFFTAWGVWNLYYYPALDQMASFTGGAMLCCANLAWIALAIRYRSN